MGSDLVSGSTLSMEPAWDWFSLSLCHSPTLEIKIKKKKCIALNDTEGYIETLRREFNWNQLVIYDQCSYTGPALRRAQCSTIAKFLIIFKQ